MSVSVTIQRKEFVLESSFFHYLGLYNSECLIENPYFVQETPDCNICKSFKQVKGLNATSFNATKFTAYSNTMKPVKLMVSFDQSFCFSNYHYNIVWIFVGRKSMIVADSVKLSQ
jgi:hypothetical protein